MAHEPPPLVSIVVRTIGRATLGRSLRAAACQEYRNIETVVVDALGAGGLDTRDGRAVRVVSDGRPLARAEAANRGVESARGDYIVLLDDDDEFLPKHIAGLVAAIARTGHMCAYSDAEAIDAAGRIVEVYDADYNRTLLHTRNLFPPHAVLFARRLIALGCRFNAALALLEDWDFWLQAAEHTSFIHVPQRTALYYIETGSSGAGHGANRDDAMVEAAARTIDARWRTRRAALERDHAERREMAIELVRSDRLDEAAPLLADLVTIDPHDVDLLALLGYCAFRSGRWDRAVSALERATALRADRADLYYNLALAHERTGRLADARLALQKSLGANPNFAPANAALARLGTT